MPKPRKKGRGPGRKRSLSKADLKRLEKLQAKKLGVQKAREVLWVSKHKKIAEKMIASLPKEATSTAKALVYGIEGKTALDGIDKLCSLAKKGKGERAIISFFEFFALHYPNKSISNHFVTGLAKIGSENAFSVLRKVCRSLTEG